MSKQCPGCNSVLNDDAAYCHMCGMSFVANQQNVAYQQNAAYQEAYQQTGYQQEAYQQNAQYRQDAVYQQPGNTTGGYQKDGIVDPNETVVGNLESSPILDFLMGGGLSKTSVFFTEKRFYTKSRRLTLRLGLLAENTVVDLKDITGTRVLQSSPIFLIVLAALQIIGFIGGIASEEAAIVVLSLIAAGIFVGLFFLLRGVIIQVHYPGGTTFVRMQNCSYATATNFHHQLRQYMEPYA